jgi:hypothetical protein
MMPDKYMIFILLFYCFLEFIKSHKKNLLALRHVVPVSEEVYVNLEMCSYLLIFRNFSVYRHHFVHSLIRLVSINNGWTATHDD